MKKQTKKLVLAKETVRTLAREEFADLVHGGSTETTICASKAFACFHSQQFSCTC